MAFCVIASSDINDALIHGVSLNRDNILRSKHKCIELLGKVAFECNGAVLFEIQDKIANEDFNGDLYVEGMYLIPVDPSTLNISDGLIKSAFSSCLTNKSNIRKAIVSNIGKKHTCASILEDVPKQKLNDFMKEYSKNYQLAKQANLNNANKIAIMTAIKKVGI